MEMKKVVIERGIPTPNPSNLTALRSSRWDIVIDNMSAGDSVLIPDYDVAGLRNAMKRRSVKAQQLEVTKGFVRVWRVV